MWITVRGQILGWLVVCHNQALKQSFKAESKSRWRLGLPRAKVVPYMRHRGWVWGLVPDAKGFEMGLSLSATQLGWGGVGSLSVSKEVWVWVLPCPDQKGLGRVRTSNPRGLSLGSNPNGFGCRPFPVRNPNGLG